MPDPQLSRFIRDVEVELQTTDDIKEQIRQFLSELLPSGSSLTLLDDTPLRTSGIVDSMDMLRLIGFIEERFQISVDADEADAHSLDRIGDIAKFVERKRAIR